MSDLGSGQTTNFSNVSIGGTDPNGTAYGTLWVGSTISAPTIGGLPSQLSASRATVGTLNVVGGAQLSGVTADFRTNAVIQSVVTYAGGASISGLTIGQWGFVQNASGFSVVFSSGKTAYFFGGSTLSAAIV